MKWPRLTISTLTAAAVLSAALASAHHSISGTYDVMKPTTIKGKVYGFAWATPHAFLFLDVMRSSGENEKWAVEGNSRESLEKTGWTASGTVRIGEEITVTAFLPRTDVNVAATLPDHEALSQVIGQLLKAGHLAHGADVETSDGRKLVFGDGK